MPLSALHTTFLAPPAIPPKHTRVRLVGRAITLAALLGCACGPPPEVAQLPSPQPPQQPPPTLQPQPQLPSVGVNEMMMDVARWTGRAVILEARLGWEVARCTKSVPPSCVGQWLLRDANEPRSYKLVMLESAIKIPLVCRPAQTSLIADSPCAPKVLDTEQRYRLEGELRSDHGELRFVPTRIDTVSR